MLYKEKIRVSNDNFSKYLLTFSPFRVIYAEIDEKQFFSVSANTYMVFYTTKYLEKEISFFKDFVGEQSLAVLLRQTTVLGLL